LSDSSLLSDDDELIWLAICLAVKIDRHQEDWAALDKDYWEGMK